MIATSIWPAMPVGVRWPATPAMPETTAMPGFADTLDLLRATGATAPVAPGPAPVPSKQITSLPASPEPVFAGLVSPVPADVPPAIVSTASVTQATAVAGATPAPVPAAAPPLLDHTQILGRPAAPGAVQTPVAGALDAPDTAQPAHSATTKKAVAPPTAPRVAEVKTPGPPVPLPATALPAQVGPPPPATAAAASGEEADAIPRDTVVMDTPPLPALPISTSPPPAMPQSSSKPKPSPLPMQAGAAVTPAVRAEDMGMSTAPPPRTEILRASPGSRARSPAEARTRITPTDDGPPTPDTPAITVTLAPLPETRNPADAPAPSELIPVPPPLQPQSQPQAQPPMQDAEPAREPTAQSGPAPALPIPTDGGTALTGPDQATQQAAPATTGHRNASARASAPSATPLTAPPIDAASQPAKLGAPATGFGEAVRASLAAPGRDVANAEPTVVTAQPGRIGTEMGIAIARHVVVGKPETITVRLDPKSLGRIAVQLSFDDAGMLRAVVSADSAVALDMLRRDSADLGRALADAGLRSDGQSLRFDTRAGLDARTGGGSDPGQRQPGADQRWPQSRHRSTDPDYPMDIETPAYRTLRSIGRVDLTA